MVYDCAVLNVRAEITGCAAGAQSDPAATQLRSAAMQWSWQKQQMLQNQLSSFCRSLCGESLP